MRKDRSGEEDVSYIRAQQQWEELYTDIGGETRVPISAFEKIWEKWYYAIALVFGAVFPAMATSGISAAQRIWHRNGEYISPVKQETGGGQKQENLLYYAGEKSGGMEDTDLSIYEPTRYVYDDLSADAVVLTELRTPAEAKNNYAYGAAGREQDTIKAEQYFTDGRGSVSELAAQAGGLINTLRYTPFGVITKGAPVEDRVYGYNAEQYTPQNDLIYLRARHYSPVMGTFTTQDSYIGSWTSPISQNRYTYGNNDPVSHKDPSGHAVVLPGGIVYNPPSTTPKAPKLPKNAKPSPSAPKPGAGVVFDPAAAWAALKAKNTSRYVKSTSPTVQTKKPGQYSSFNTSARKYAQQILKPSFRSASNLAKTKTNATNIGKINTNPAMKTASSSQIQSKAISLSGSISKLITNANKSQATPLSKLPASASVKSNIINGKKGTSTASVTYKNPQRSLSNNNLLFNLGSQLKSSIKTISGMLSSSFEKMRYNANRSGPGVGFVNFSVTALAGVGITYGISIASDNKGNFALMSTYGTGVGGLHSGVR